MQRLAGMGPATFHRHFKAVTAMTPVQYQKARRLLFSDHARIGYEKPVAVGNIAACSDRPPGRDGQEIRNSLMPQING
ncbi:hypothetical protein [Paenirhodobacter sp.]|uniref:hypothetical protein n=1 Tax=Paenirhodobacter sp. TaxID=1965326 RepID=UPI003B3E1902